MDWSYFYSHLPYYLDPVAFSLGIFSVRWYSLMYIFAAVTFLVILRWRLSHDPYKPFDQRSNEAQWNFILEAFYISFLGLILGARIGYIAFYDFSGFLQHPLSYFTPFLDGVFVGYLGMSFHGGLIGAVLAGYIYCRKKKLDFVRLANYVIPAIPLAYVWGRLGNFFNSEIFGRPTDSKLGMFFPTDPQNQLRHPSQLYEAVGEGALIFIILWPLRNRPGLQGKFLALYLILYGLVRFFLEFFREPDSVMFKAVSMGQLLCVGMVVAGIILIRRKK